ncbi:Ig-like domain-containing protein [Aquimarina algicola]|uniref:T9SS type A sorting domain-containing protein n=1 Tax=Aquimarina algicola TaxID=2589995 RepID=A0A504JF64_9FLAO|nr:Ig-like domain-containing protein [Aquimarina algicola]TPN85150.1 T9SS type A sorting domain-containing protein [Aquimarina algicola]
MKKYYLCIAFAILLILQVNASNDKYRLTLRDNPATTIVIGWNQISGNNPIVHYGPVDQGTDYDQYVYSAAPSRIVSYRGMNNHFVRLSRLKPDTAYYFVIKDSEGVSKRFWFKTAPLEESRFSFIAGGDSRNNRVPRQNANLLVSKLKPHAVLFGGDMTDNDTDSQWRAWFDDWQLTTALDGRMFPIIAARGNHEKSNSTIVNLFDIPSSHAHYAITFGRDMVRTYTLNSLDAILGRQTDWLKNDLANSREVTWKIAQYHFPIRPHVSSKGENLLEYAGWAKTFYDEGVKLVVECDAHTVKSTWPVRPSTGSGSEEGFVRDDNGTVYVGEGCWGAPLRDNNDIKGWTRDSGKFNQFKWIFVDRAKMETRTIKVDNAAEVGEVANDNVFEIPDRLDIWNPSNGSVIKIINKDLKAPEVSFVNPKEGQQLYSGGASTITVEATDADGEISRVEFYLDGDLIHTDVLEPYSTLRSLPDGVHKIKAVAYDNHELCSEAEITVNVGQFSGSLTIPVAHGYDDVEENAIGQLYVDSSDLELVYDSVNLISFQKIGIRFQDIKIPRGALITGAYIQFTADESTHKRTELEFSLHSSDNSEQFTDKNNASKRDVVSYKIRWKPEPWTAGQSGALQKTPDLKGMVQQVVDRAGWRPGNSMSFIIRGKGRSSWRTKYKRVASAYESGAEKAAKLIVNYTFGGVRSKETQEVETVAVKVIKDDQLEGIKVYPNPFEQELQVLIPNAEVEEVTVEIYDTAGNLVFSKVTSVEANNLSIRPEILDKGMYIIHVIDAKGFSLVTKRVLKK